jgi:hypothetical protein
MVRVNVTHRPESSTDNNCNFRTLFLSLTPQGGGKVRVNWGPQVANCHATHLTLPIADATGPLPLPHIWAEANASHLTR